MKQALLIGVNNYSNVENCLRYPVQDTQHLSQLLRNYGTKVTVIASNEENLKPTDDVILDHLKELKESDTAITDSLLVYFSGHGQRLLEIPFILPSNLSTNNISDCFLDSLSDNDTFDKKIDDILGGILKEENLLHVNLQDLKVPVEKILRDKIKKVDIFKDDVQEILLIEIQENLSKRFGKAVLGNIGAKIFRILQETFLKKLESELGRPIAIQEIISLMNASPARQKILIIDACFAGIDLDNLTADLGQLFRDATGSPGSHKTNDDHTKVADEGKKRYGGYALFYEAEGFAMLAASTGSQVSREAVALKHGYFTYHLLNGLGGKALRDNKPFITVTDIALYTAQQLRNMSWGEGFQEPTSLMAMKGDMILVESQAFEPDYRPLIVPRRMVFRYNARFVSRKDELEELAKGFVHSDNQTAKRLATAVGMGGIGKTQVAGQFIYEHERDFPGGVFWLNFAKGEEIKNEIADCGSNLYMNLKGFEENNIEESFKAVMEEWNREDAPRRLLIFDNCEDPQLLADYLPDPKSKCCVLVTSRRRYWDAEGNNWRENLSQQIKDKLSHFAQSPLLLQLKKLQTNDSVALLCNFHEFSEAEKRGVLCEIAERVGNLPLALHQAGSVLFPGTVPGGKGITPPEYLNMLSSIYTIDSKYIKRVEEIVKSSVDSGTTRDEEDLPTGHVFVGPTFEISYVQLVPKEDDLARKLLFRASFFKPNEPIPTTLLIKSLNTSEEANAKALDRLIDLGLLNWSGREETQGYVVHPLVAAFVQARPNKPDLDEQEAKEKDKEAAEKDKKAVGEAEAAEELRKEAEELRKKAEELRKAAKNLRENEPNLAKDLEQAQTDVERAMYEEAKKLLRDEEDIIEMRKLQSHLIYISSAAKENQREWSLGLCTEASFYLYRVGNFESAESYFTYAENICDLKIKKSDSSSYTVEVIDCLAVSLRLHRYNLNKAFIYQEYTLKVCPENTEYRRCLAIVLQMLGKLRQSQAEIELVLDKVDPEWRTGNFKKTRSDELYRSYNVLLSVLFEMGKYEEALKCAERLQLVLPLKEQEYNLNLLVTKYNLAKALMLVGQNDDAMKRIDEVNEIQEKIYGKEVRNLDLAINYHLWGKLLRLQRKFDEAKKELNEARKIFEELYGVDSSDVADELNELALLLKETGELPQARVYAERALNIRETELGPDHPLVAESLYVLAAILHKQGSSVDARRLAERALKTCLKKELVEEHYVVKALRELLADLG